MPRVVHFEINADQPERASKFYSSVFGWEIKKWDGPMDYWLVTTGKDGTPGINGAIMNRMPATTTVNTVDVPSVDGYLKKITEHGGKAVTPKMPIPTVGYFAYCQDTEGNAFGVIEFDKSAK